MSWLSSLLPESTVLCELLPLSQKVPQTRWGPLSWAPQATAQSPPSSKSSTHRTPKPPGVPCHVGRWGLCLIPSVTQDCHTFLLVDSLQSVACFQTVLSNGLTLPFVGEIRVWKQQMSTGAKFGEGLGRRS